MFLACLAQGCEKTAWRVHAFVRMGNHYHLRQRLWLHKAFASFDTLSVSLQIQLAEIRFLFVLQYIRSEHSCEDFLTTDVTDGHG